MRRSRRRFWEGDAGVLAALATLHECLETVTRLMAPLTPFVTERVWSALRDAGRTGLGAPGRWPEANAALIDEELSAADGAGPTAGRARPGGPRRRPG